MSRQALITTATIAFSVTALALAPVSGGSGAVSAKAKSVFVKDDSFSPRSVTVLRGGKVVWRWRGTNPHNVRFRKVPSGASRRGSATQTSGRFARSFGKRGTYRYVCTIHEDIGMKGRINVE